MDNPEQEIQERIESGERPSIRKRKLKELEKLKDPKSTGRKQAVLVKPLKPGEPCEWRGLKYAGGGTHPIIGCVTGLQENVHHGPDKSTTSNYVTNLSGCCSRCHNRWHTVNDKYYPVDDPLNFQGWWPEGTCYQHNPNELAPQSDILNSEIFWSKPKAQRDVPYEIAFPLDEDKLIKIKEGDDFFFEPETKPFPQPSGDVEKV
jgi:hypothetical protein